MLDLSDVELPFSVTDLVTGGTGLFGIVSTFLILTMAGMFARDIMRILFFSIKWWILTGKENKFYASRGMKTNSFKERIDIVKSMVQHEGNYYR